nr:putative ribonuclease H-like domain-containing protein [Tanacetum cinerariifolium]
MEYWITNNDMNIWKVIQNGNSLKRTGRDRDGRVIILPLTTVDEHIAVQRESKERTTLLWSIPNDHVADFHYMDDARDIWNAVKARIGKAEGLHKGYDKMQKILSLLNQLEAKPEDEDINLKFLRALPSSWSQVALTLKTKGGLELLSFDDLYYKLKTLEVDVKGYTTFSLSQSAGPSHSAFVSTTSASKKMSYGDCPSYSSTTTYTAPSNSKTGSHRSDFEQIEKLDLEEMDLKWKMAMLSVRVHKFEQKAGRKIDFDKKESARANGGNDNQRYSSFKIKEIGKKEEYSKALITVDTLVDWTDHDGKSDGVIASKEFGMIAGYDTKDTIEEGAAKIYNLITGADTEEASTAGDAGESGLIGVTSEVHNCPFGCNNKYNELQKQYNKLNEQNSEYFIQVQAYKNSLKTLEKQKRVLQRNQLILEDKIRVLSIELENTSNLLKHSKRINTDVETAKKELQTKLDNHLVQNEKENELGWDDSAFSVFTTNSEDVEGRPLFNRFAKYDSMKAVPPPLSGDYTSLSDHIYLDESQMSYGTKSSTSSDPKSVSNEFVSCNDSDKSSEFVPQAVLLRTGKVNISPARPQPIPTGKPKVFAPVPTGRQNRPFLVLNDRGYSPSVISCWWKSTAGHMPYFSRPTSSYFQTYTPYVPTMYYNHMKYGGDRWATAVKPSAGAEDEGVFDSGCSRSMTGNKERLNDFQEFQGGKVTFGGGKDTECLVLSKDFKLPDESMVVLRVPRKHNLYTINLNNLCPREHKDETSPILKDFINLVENQLNKKVKSMRCDNGTEFKNTYIIELCGSKGIKREYSNARTSQQNRVTERKNRTLIEAARTMLADSKVYNMPNEREEETMNLLFLEEKPNVQGLGHEWYFDLNYLTDTLGYKHVQANQYAGTQAAITNPAGACKAERASATTVPPGSIPVPTSSILIPSGDTMIFPGDVPVHTSSPTDSVFDDEPTTRFLGPSDLGNHDPSPGIFSSSSYDDGFGATLNNVASTVEMDVKSAFLYGRIDEEVYVTQPKGLVDPQHPKKAWCDEFEALIKGEFQMSAMGELTFFLVSAYSRNQVTPTTSNLEAVKKIFKYLKGQPKLGLWYPRESLFVLEAYSDSDYAGANKDRNPKLVDVSFWVGGTLDTKSVVRLWPNDSRWWISDFQVLYMDQIIDFLRASHIRYALTHDPIIFDSLVKQFWSTATLRSLELGPPAIQATIDKTPYTIIKDLVRSQLQLADDGGIDDLPTAEIYSGMDNLGILHCLITKSGVAVPTVPQHMPAPDQPQDHLSTPPRQQTSDPNAPVFKHGQSSDPNIASFSRTHETDDAPFTNVEDASLGGSFHMSLPRSTQAPLAEGNSLETKLKDYIKLFKDMVGKLVKKVKAIEVRLRTTKRKMVVSDSDQEGGGKQDVDLDALLALANAPVTVDSNISPGGASDNPAASTSVSADVPTSANVPTGSTSIPIDVPSSVAPAGVSNKGKALMVEEDIVVKERTFKQMQEDILGEQAAKRLHDKEQAQVKAGASLSKTLLGDDVSENNFPARMAALIKRKKQALNQSCVVYSTRWSMARVKSFTDDQLKEEFEKIQKAISNIQIQAFCRTLKRTGPVLEEPSSKRQKSTEAPILFVLKVPQLPVVSSPKSSGTRRKSLGRNHLTKPKSKLQELDLDVDDKTFIKVVSDEDSKDEAPHPWSALVGGEVIATPLGDINALYRIDRSTKHFTTLRQILHMVDRQDLVKLYGLVVKYYENRHVAGAGLILEVVFMFVDVSYPLSVKLMERMLTHKLEIDKDVVGNDMTTAEQLIRVFNSSMLHLLRVEMVINSPWIMPILGAKELASTEQTAPDAPFSRDISLICADFSSILVKTQSSWYVVPTGRVVVPTGRGGKGQDQLSKDFQLPDDSMVVLRVPRKHNLYTINLNNLCPRGNLACLVAHASFDEFVKWHRRMGHVNYNNMNRLVKGNLVRGLPPKLFKNDHTCVACCKGKQHKASYTAIHAVSSISQPLQLLHMDLFGPISIRRIDHKYYCLVITDDYSRFCWVFFLEHKDETYPILKDFINLVENQLNKNVKAMRCDNGIEFKNAHMIKLYGSKGIKREYSNPRTSQQNGIAERKNRTLIEVAKTMLADSKLPTMFWTEGVRTTCYVLNRVSVTSPYNKTPYALLTGNIPSVSHFKPFGYHVTILNTNDHLGKFDGKADEGYIVGYSASNKAYRVYNVPNKRVEESMNLRFLEEKPNAHKEPQLIMQPKDTSGDKVNDSPFQSADEIFQKELARLKDPEQRVTFDAESLGLGFTNNAEELQTQTSAKIVPLGCILVPPSKVPVPTGSIPIPAAATKVSTDDVLVHTSSLTDLIFDDEPTTKFSYPSDLGNHDPSPGNFSSSSYDDDFDAALYNVASTVEVNPMATTRNHTIHSHSLIIGDPTLAVQTRSKVKQTTTGDSAFALKNPSWVDAMQEEMQQFKFQNVWVLVDLPASKYAIGTKWILKNKRDARGIVVLDLWMLRVRFSMDELMRKYMSLNLRVLWILNIPRMSTRRGIIDKTLFFKKNNRDIILVQVYVDDIIFGSTKKAWCDEFEALIKEEFKMSAMGELTFFLGLQVQQRPDGIFINQDKYVQEILTKFDLGSVRTTTTPYEAPKPKSKNESDSLVNVHLYRSMIGSLMYLIASRPDIMFVVSACSRHQVTPTTSNLEAVKKIFKYLKRQPKLCLWYPKESPLVLEAYSDSDYAGANKDKKSTTSGCQFIGRWLISWQCKKQTIVATYSTEVEYVVAANCRGQTGREKGSSCTVFQTVRVTGVKVLGLGNFGPCGWFALTHNPIILDSLVKQFWSMAILRAPELEIYSKMDNLGYVTEGKLTFFKNKFSPQWRRRFNWSSYIFKGMVNNIGNAKKFLMYPRFLQIILGIETRVTRQYKVLVFSSKLFANMQLNFAGNPMPLLPIMLLQAQAGEGAKVAAQAVPQPVPVLDQPQAPLSTPSRQQTSDLIAPVLEHGQSSDPHTATFSRSHETDAGPFTPVEDAPMGGDFHTSPPRSSQAPPAGQPSSSAKDPITLTALSSVVSTLVQKVHSLESKLKDHKKLFKDVVGKLVKKVKALEVKLKTKKRKMVVNDSNQEDGGKQDMDLDAPSVSTAGPPDTSVVPPDTFVVPPGTFVVPTGASTAPASSPNVPTDVPSSAAPAGVSSKGKSLMVEEDIPVKARTFKQIEEDRLGKEAPKRLHDEKMAQMERQRAEVEANASLSKTLLGDDVFEDNFPARMAALIKKKRQAVAAKLAQERHNRPMTQAQQKAYMRQYIRKVQSNSQIQAFSRTLNRLGLVLEEPFSKRKQSTEARIPSVPEVPHSPVVSSPPSSRTKRKSLGQKHILKLKSTLLKLDLDVDAQTFIKVVVNEDSDDEVWSAVVGWEVLPTPLGEINALYCIDGSTKHFTTLHQFLHMVLSMFTDVSYPISVKLMERMLMHKLELDSDVVGNDMTIAEQLIQFIKNQLAAAQASSV